ncbi:MAG TPA: hypothetical protein VHX60_13170 [Acidobacteriaceae bacterium]|nr:hypothetical protein [Acidobacteriaceae bacterium]
MWIAVLLVAAGILAWLVFYSPGHEPILSNHNGAVVMLHLPEAPQGPERSLERSLSTSSGVKT